MSQAALVACTRSDRELLNGFEHDLHIWACSLSRDDNGTVKVVVFVLSGYEADILAS